MLCLKVSARIDGWLREAYFGQVLDELPQAIRVYDTFPLVRTGAGPRLLYCLAIEYARHGDLSAFLKRTAKSWPERTARREIAGILQVLGRLHRGQMLHRDLTPLNVFVCDDRRLKLGDFGIARPQNSRRGITAHTLNTSMVPSDMLAAEAPKWRARDDVYQVGQLIAMLVKGDATARIRLPEVRRLGCSDQLKEIIYRCIGERRKRYESADDLIDALVSPPASLKAGVLRSLKGRPPRVHRHPHAPTQRSRARRAPRRRHRPRRPLRKDDRRRPRPPESAPGRRTGRRPQADGDQAPQEEGAQDHAAQ